MKSKSTKKIRYAVVGQGHIAQVAVLPAFRQTKNSELKALVSGDPYKLKKLSKKYRVPAVYSYEEYDECLKSGEIDAVYIALPNRMHREYSVRAAKAGIHVLCEKPLTVTTKESEEIIRSAKENQIKLMVAYRLHFDPANLKAIKVVNSGKIGQPLFFTSQFGHKVKTDNIRMQPEEGGSPLNDLGIYCINAVRNIFKCEPLEVFAFAGSPNKRFSEIHESITAVLRFPSERLASFTCSFGSAEISNYRIVGTLGDLSVENGFEYVGKMKERITVREKTREWRFKAGDQFAAELQYFSNCILKNRDPEPSGLQGLADVKIIEALDRSIRTGAPVSLRGEIRQKIARPTLRQKLKRPPHRKPQLVKVESEAR